MATMATMNASTTDRRTVAGVFDGPNHAETALNQLKAAGFSPEQVSVVARDKGEAKEMVESTGMGSGTATGAATGGVLGGVAGFLVGISAMVIPGIGPIVGAGILASTLVGAGVGAAAGGLVGALAEHGVPEEDARGYEEHVRRGSILLTVHADTDEEAREAHRLLAGGTDVRAYGTGGARESMARIGGTGTAAGTPAAGTLADGGRDVISSGELRDEGRDTRGR
jgi:uncharacterized membrane protein